MTAVANSAFTAAQFNQYVRDNLNESAPAKATGAGGYIMSNGVNSVIQRNPGSDTINTSQTSNSTSYVDLASVGPRALAVVSDVRALVFFTAQMNNNTASTETITSVAVDGATTIAPDDNVSIAVDQPSGGAFVDVTCCRATRFSVTAGSNDYTMKYRVTGGTGTWRRRQLVVLPG